MLHATDTFDKMYSFLIAKRLIDMDNCNIERETKFVDQNKAEFGEQFNQKVEQMFQDVNESIQLTAEFK